MSAKRNISQLYTSRRSLHLSNMPWPGVVKAYIARSRVWTALDEAQKVMDEGVKDMGESVDET